MAKSMELLYNGALELGLTLDDKKLSEQMGEAGRKFIEEKFSTESMAKTFVDIIKPYLKDK